MVVTVYGMPGCPACEDVITKFAARPEFDVRKFERETFIGVQPDWRENRFADVLATLSMYDGAFPVVNIDLGGGQELWTNDEGAEAFLSARAAS